MALAPAAMTLGTQLSSGVGNMKMSEGLEETAEVEEEEEDSRDNCEVSMGRR